MRLIHYSYEIIKNISRKSSIRVGVEKKHFSQKVTFQGIQCENIRQIGRNLGIQINISKSKF